MSPDIKGLCGDKDGSVLWDRAHLRHGGNGNPQYHRQHCSKQHQFPVQLLPPSFSLRSSAENSQLTTLILSEISSARCSRTPKILGLRKLSTWYIRHHIS